MCGCVGVCAGVGVSCSAAHLAVLVCVCVCAAAPANRSHQRILDVFSSLFYNNELMRAASPRVTDAAKRWSFLATKVRLRCTFFNRNTERRSVCVCCVVLLLHCAVLCVCVLCCVTLCCVVLCVCVCVCLADPPRVLSVICCAMASGASWKRAADVLWRGGHDAY